MKYSVLFVLFCLIGFCFFPSTLAASEFEARPEQIKEFYIKAAPASLDLAKRLVKDGQTQRWPDLDVMQLSSRIRILAMAQIELPDGKKPSIEPIKPLLEALEELQDRDPQSPTFGNYRWYYRNEKVTDHNAVEFTMTNLIPVWYEAKGKIPGDSREILERMLRRAVDGTLTHRVRPDYTNITVYNFVHLMLLGQAFDRPDAVIEAKKRLESFMITIWDHGIFEYNSPWYYPISVDSLQLGLRYANDSETKFAFQKLLDFFWTDLALNWYLPSLRNAGAQSRTYRYLHGNGDSTRLFEFVGLAPADTRSTSSTRLNSFGAPYKPDSKILALSKEYPRLVSRRWGMDSSQWSTTFIQKDIALGMAGAAYRGARQNMVLTVDLADFETMPSAPPSLLPRNYFIADGREDPYGTKRYAAHRDGHSKALHLEACWLGSQRSVDALGVVIYTPEALKEPVLTNVQSHFVFRKPDALVFEGKPVDLSAKPVEIGDKPVFMRYGSKTFGVRIPWTRGKDGQSPKAYLIDDKNEHGVYRLTIDHWKQGVPVSGENLDPLPGAAFWVRVGSQLDSDMKFDRWSRDFQRADVKRLKADLDSISIQVSGVDGPVSIDASKLSDRSYRVETVPPPPTGILTLDGKEIGRPILESIPSLLRLAKRKKDSRPILIKRGGTYWEAEKGFCFQDDLREKQSQASGGEAFRINSDVSWKIRISEPNKYYLWARVSAPDAQHDSVFVDWKKQLKSSYEAGGGGDWHLGFGPQWRWIRLGFDNKSAIIPMELDAGVWQLSLRPREQDALFDKFFMTTDPKAEPSESLSP